MLKLSDFDYSLPNELIAYDPSLGRQLSKLLIVNNKNDFINLKFANIIDFLAPGDLIIFNNSKVLRARLFAQKTTGGKIEVLVERIVNNSTLTVHLRSNKTISIGLEIVLPNNILAIVTSKTDHLFTIEISQEIDFINYLEKHGHIPLPPYINRCDNFNDSKYYQTVYAAEPGSVASPTAGLHFSEQLVAKIKQKKVNTAFITLHIGSGTFKPVKTDDITKHTMHSEVFNISSQVLKQIIMTKRRGNKVIAVGTTSARTLESVSSVITPYFDNNKTINLADIEAETDIFISPGYKFNIVDKLITNFHLPKSTLLMLVAAFTGYEEIMNAYSYAIDNKYKFYSYGDAMLLFKKDNYEN